MKHKKSFLSILIFAFLLFPAIAISSPITAISYDYDILLRLEGTVSIQEDHSYSGSGEGPAVSHSIFIPDYYGTWPGGGSVLIKGEVSPYDVYVYGHNLESDWTEARATGQWTFIPNYDNVKINIEGYLFAHIGASWSESQFIYSLYDFTESNYLANETRWAGAEHGGEENDHLYLTEIYRLEAAHIYGLTLFGYAGSYDGAVASLSANFSVPEPSTILLLCVGLMGLAGFGRRKFKKNVS